jgi:hypothetical protein
MPVRKIPKNHIFVTGRHASQKSTGNADFESPLENDHLILLDFDPRVKSYEVQPVTVPVPGVPKGYTPDVLVHFYEEQEGTSPSELVEVKTHEDFETNKLAYAPKFAAAEAFARDRGWVFVRKSDKDIRTPKLSNLKFLRAYRRVEPLQDHVDALLGQLEEHGGRSTSERLLSALCTTADSRAELLPTLWHLVLTHRITADWNVPFGADVPLWQPKDAHDSI